MGDLVGHREYSSEGKIDPAGIDMDAFRREAQAIIDRVYGGTDMNDDQNNALSAVWNQVGVPHKVRKVFQKVFYNVKEGEMWTRAGLADVWNEVVWDGFVNPVDLLDGKVDPDNAPAGTPVEKLARRGSFASYLLATYREATLARRAAEEIRDLLKESTK